MLPRHELVTAQRGRVLDSKTSLLERHSRVELSNFRNRNSICRLAHVRRCFEEKQERTISIDDSRRKTSPWNDCGVHEEERREKIITLYTISTYYNPFPSLVIWAKKKTIEDIGEVRRKSKT